MSGDPELAFLSSGSAGAEALLLTHEGAEAAVESCQSGRFPDGIGEEGFFQKEVPDYFPSWITRVEVMTTDGETQRQVVLGGNSLSDDRAALRYLNP